MSPSACVCPKCGAALPSTATEGLCPRCLFAQLEEPVAPEGVESEAEGSDAGMASREGAGEREFGDYELFEEIGEGGMGVVYRARQVSLNRPVALKLIKLGMDTRKIIARFEAERQALALMDHPGIARVFDAGATQTGRPYFVMELVRGVKITDYCEQRQLSTNERLALFMQVCQAVQHAHQKGIIHRDLKPSNILVSEFDGRPLPKIIDFGIAKATEGHLVDQTLSTVAGQFVGTPAYLSPEQAELGGVDIDTRSDIYSLGVLLYELLTGCLPFEPKALAKASFEEMRRTIREVKPVRPSTRLKRTQSVGERTHPVESQIVNRKSQIDPDLDWIVMKCLEKDRTRRYETANGLAMDLRRHLDNAPVLARPPSRLYEFRKSVQRHKVGFAATGAIILVLLAGVLVSTWQAVRAINAQHAAVAARRQADVARDDETKLRRQAQVQELAARQRAYASDMNLAMRALDQDNLGGALDLLDGQRPKPGQRDLRGWEWRYLWHQTRSDALFPLCQINGEVESLAASPDGHWLAVGARHEGGVTVWDLRTRREVAPLATNEEVAHVAYSPTEPLLAFAAIRPPHLRLSQSILSLWNSAKQQMVTNWPLDRICVGLGFSQDGRTLVTSTAWDGIRGGQITLWRVSDGTKLTNYPGTTITEESLNNFATTPDLSLAASGLAGAKIRVVDLRTGKALWTTNAGKQYITALAFSPNGKTLASAAGFGESDIRLWDVATGKEMGRLEGHTYWVSSLVFWPDGKRLASSSADQTIRIWDVPNHKCLDILRGHRNEVWRLALLPDQKTLVSGGKDGTVCFWDTSITHPRRRSITVPAKVRCWCFTRDGQSVLTLDPQGQVARWSGYDFQREEPLLSLPAAATVGPIFSPHGRLLAVGLTNGVVQVWGVARQALWRQLTNSAGPISPRLFLPDGDKLLTWTPGRSLQEWDLTTAMETRPGPVSRKVVMEFPNDRISPDGRLAVVAGEDGGLVLDLASPSSTKTQLNILEGWEGIAFSPGGRRVAITSHLGYVRVWDTATWREEATLRGFLHAAGGVAFSPDRKRLATGDSSPNKAVNLWDVDSWQNVFTLEGQGTGYVFKSTAFSSDGNTIGARNDVGTLVLWRAPSWAQIAAQEKADAETAHPPQTETP